MKSNITVIILFIVCCLVSFYIGYSNTNTIIETKTEIETIVEVDTVYVERTDTVFVEVEIDKPTIVTLPDIDEPVNKYENSVTDSLINGTITTWTDGTIYRQTFDYLPLFPMYINTTTETTKTVTNTVFKSGLYYGVELNDIVGNISFNPQVYYIRQKYGIGYKHDILNKTHNISLLYRW